MDISQIALKKKLRKLGITTYRNKVTGACFIKKKALERILSYITHEEQGLQFEISKDDDEYSTYIHIKAPYTSEKAIDFLEDHWETIWRSRYKNYDWQYAIAGDDQLAIHARDIKSLKTILKEVVDVLKEEGRINLKEH